MSSTPLTDSIVASNQMLKDEIASLWKRIVEMREQNAKLEQEVDRLEKALALTQHRYLA